ncbi:hypothetical protein CFC21_022549 [Triticum aestivum]|uniref:Mitochondrial import inner membrane translocase subunit TIM17 n=3 Tax=Triticum TaxID=4564 RepID=A0A9R1RJW1_TRITD|nr:mitochondrial import inner membrane translocase subunit TIM17-1-like [Triticum dicoccoides]XP_044319643.1 mitochondrial import inner membrane translocase subunit TIM17-1-like [Triticum aestivum]KAF7007624.1 hypothetical protein CFC21_022549 [Triticum aestivum]VAH43965.1 unnamed protein product [Triticum turgidum subsp. durum]
MSAPLLDRDPCPDRIIEDAGGTFAMGAVGGSVFHLLKGLHNSPNGARISGGMQAVRSNAPRIGGSFAVWGTVFSITSCAAVFVRQKEDPWNSVIAGAATHGFLHLRMGLRVAGRRAVYGGCLLALIEGGALMVNRLFDAKKNPPPRPRPAHDPNLATAIPCPPQPAVSPAEVASSSGGGSWFGGLFGKEKEKKASGSGGKSEVLESFETPSPPMPSSSEYK